MNLNLGDEDYCKSYYQRNREALKEKARIHRLNNKEYYTEYNKKWRESNPDYHKTEEYKARGKKWKEANPHKVFFLTKRGEAKKKGIEFSLVFEDTVFPTHCPVLCIELNYGHKGTGHAVNNSPSFDRIDPSKGYVPGNVIIVSLKANRIKNDASVSELVAVANFYKELIGAN